MAQQNEDPAGMNRGATTNNAAHDNDNHTHSNGHGSAQDREWAAYNSTSASHRPDIEAIEVQSGIVDVFHVKLRNAGTVAVGAGQLADFRRFNQACIAQLWCAFDPPPSATVWNRHIHAALRKATRLKQSGETLHLHGTGSWGDADVEWTVHERIPRTGVGLLSGPFGSFKTFILLETAGSLMTEIPFLGRTVRRRCGTLIFAAEGADTIRQRNHALIEHRLAKAELNSVNLEALPFAFVDGCRPLLDPRTVDWMVAQARMAQAHFRSQHGLDLGFIGIDTIAAAAGWDNENDAAQAQIVMNHLADVSAATGTFVLAVDHFGQDITRGSRGSTAKESAAGTIFYIYGKSDNIGGFTDTKLVLRKQRGGPQGMVFPFNAREVQIGTDRYGEPQTSRVIDWNVERSEQKPKEEKPPSAQAILEGVLAEALDRHGTEIKANGTNAVRAVRKDTVRFAFKTAYLAKHAGADASAVRQAWQRALKQAKATVAEGIEDSVPYLWRPASVP